ncbi:tyrosine-type recombinase/integrase [Streptomyces sp. NPDC050355]|uniref:tyrosine-type recombinase/integrase n=1 Tax=Streptomyces sp. NPDC050355 TaxID=3365609 RepID=UPI0037AD1C84
MSPRSRRLSRRSRMNGCKPRPKTVSGCCRCLSQCRQHSSASGPFRRGRRSRQGRRMRQAATSWLTSWVDRSRPTSFGVRAHRLMERAGVRRVRLYDARHAVLSWMANNSVPDTVVSAWAGHSDLSFTKRVYVHPDPQSLRAGSDKLGELLAG